MERARVRWVTIARLQVLSLAKLEYLPLAKDRTETTEIDVNPVITLERRLGFTYLMILEFIAIVITLLYHNIVRQMRARNLRLPEEGRHHEEALAAAE